MKTAIRRSALVLSLIGLLSFAAACTPQPRQWRLEVAGFEFFEPDTYNEEGELEVGEAPEADLLVIDPLTGEVSKEIDVWLQDLARVVGKTADTISYRDLKGLEMTTSNLSYVTAGTEVTVRRNGQVLGTFRVHTD